MKDCSRYDLETLPAGDCEEARAARIYAALGHGVRLRILRHLMQQDACCCKEIVSTVDLAQSTVSQHLKVLVQAGLVDYRPERQSSRYSVNAHALATIRTHLSGLEHFAAERNRSASHKCG
ncbi:ArsR family transcriptional regulator [Paramesorhizobium deserti]|uniref:ArsR family transcriptional regulator n=1 Tax=Paramesorhizobium deserti TaxID=1494590 RepID=A0A135HXY4_9HYPH|nr:metalloregulator ArsR/SmtB family transcription factor [Paramesorhizobium deserti]KXF78070.1 ArsR family transcriptional regulator [Paramesorhizobium deserti]